MEAITLRRRTAGMSLLEILISVFLVAVFALSMAALMPAAARMRAKAEHYNKATNVGQIMLERIRTLDYAQLTYTLMYQQGLVQNLVTQESARFVAGFNALSLPGGVTVTLSDYLPSGTGTIEVINVSSDLRSIIVTTSWSDRGITRNVTLSTIVARLN